MYHGQPEHEEWDAFDRDYHTDKSKAISYGHPEEEWDQEWEGTCGQRPFCAQFSKLMSRDHREFRGHHEEHDGEEWYSTNGM
jgi:hypothetical protein